MFTIISLIFGALGIGYSTSTMIRKRIEVYSIRKGEVVEYVDQPARVVSAGLFVASCSLMFVAANGFHFGVLMIAAICYYGGLTLANQMLEDNYPNPDQ